MSIGVNISQADWGLALEHFGTDEYLTLAIVHPEDAESETQ
jgi:hypothetical protein